MYQLAYKLALDIFNTSKSFPKEEKYSLTDQIRRSSRSIAANIAEGFRKRQYPKMFISKLADADGEATETQVWLNFARDCNYLLPIHHAELIKGYEEIGKMLGTMMSMPEKFARITKSLSISNHMMLPAFRFLHFTTFHPTHRR
ncbi:MAG TPA: four helix bundle protein [Anaerolineales bacterium]|nr:four helix bundle protein [Anaerolineales bacterium]